MADLKNTKKGKSKLQSVSFSKGDGKNKLETRVRVEEIKNGFLVIKNTEGRNAKGDWEYNEEKWYSDSNPLAIKTDDKSLADLFD